MVLGGEVENCERNSVISADTSTFGRNKLFRQNNRKVLKSPKNLLPNIRQNNGRNYSADTLYGRSLLQVGDKLVQINGVDVSAADHSKVVELLTGPERFVNITVERTMTGMAPSSSNHNSVSSTNLFSQPSLSREAILSWGHLATLVVRSTWGHLSTWWRDFCSIQLSLIGSQTCANIEYLLVYRWQNFTPRW